MQIETPNDKTCIVCGETLSPSPRYPGLLHCPNCSFLTADLGIGCEDIFALYGHDYFHGSEYGNYLEEQAALEVNFARRLSEIRALPHLDDKSRLFEIGCAYGFFLRLAQAHFAEVAGIDVAEAAVNHARDVLKLDVRCGDVLIEKIPPSPDVVCMWDVIEHLERPDLVIGEVAEALAPGGYVCITTGDVGSWVARFRGPKWRMIPPPTHLHYFDRTTLSRLLANHGLEVVSTTYPPVVRTLGTLLHGIFKLRLGADNLYRFLAKVPGQRLPIPINLFDIMSMTARKPG